MDRCCTVMIDTPCDRPSDWKYLGIRGTIYLCDVHRSVLEVVAAMHGYPVAKQLFRRIRRKVKAG